MTDIKPRYEDGEPCCDPDCPSFVSGGILDKCRARKVKASFGLADIATAEGEDCIPALRQQRDKAMWAYCVQTASLHAFERSAVGPDILSEAKTVCEKSYGPAAAARLFPEVKP